MKIKDNPDIIVLAAGLSSRMPGWKMALPLERSTVLATTVDNALKTGFRLIVVTGHRSDEVPPMLPPPSDRLIITENHDYRQGMAGSVQAAFPYLKSDRFFITLGDMPLITPELYHHLASLPFEEALIPEFKGRRGHPVLLSSTLVPALASLPKSGRVKDVLNGSRGDTVSIDDEAVVFDLDKDEDYRRLLSRYEL